jgi:hypothetical protein
VIAGALITLTVIQLGTLAGYLWTWVCISETLRRLTPPAQHHTTSEQEAYVFATPPAVSPRSQAVAR